MSLKFINDFQLRIYHALADDHAIRSRIDKIYVSIVQDAKYPFLLINFLKVEDCSKTNHAMYNVDFEICVFARDKTQGLLVSIADMIVVKLTPASCVFENYLILGMKNQYIAFDRSQDLVTTKLIVRYKALVQQEL